MTSKNRTLVSSPLAYSSINYPQKLLSGLGKPTKRGIRKCVRCGVYNGSRSTMCKNKQCRVFLRDSEGKSSVDLDAVKLITGPSKQVYSVRVLDMGPDYRGFIQLPLLHSYSEEDSSALSKVALCFVDSCQRSFDDSILKCHEEKQIESNTLCAHINSALSSRAIAVAVEFKNDIVQTLKIPKEFKQKIVALANEKEGPLVQRVSKSIMAVKCQVTPKHPLGYLHFTFVRAKGKDYYDRYYCSCTEFTAFENKAKSDVRLKCIHYYACVCVLAGNPKYSQEFNFLVNCNTPTKNDVRLPPHTLMNRRNNVERDTSSNKRRVNVIYNHLIEKSTFQVESEVSAKKSKSSIQKLVPVTKKCPLKRCPKIMPKILPVEIKVLNESEISNQLGTPWYFLDWLTYVTESINNTMQFENCGLINSLIFCIPEEFYKNLKQRIPDVYQETQIAGLSQNFYIMNILHLKEIFDTPKIKLKISKKFVHNEEKGYVEYNENEDNNDNFQSTFIFFINVGQSTVDESDNTNNSFVIEWIPNITSLTRIGQLKLQYKYGKKST